MGGRRRASKIDAWLWGILRSFIGVVVGVGLIAGMVGLLLWSEVGVLQAQRALDMAGVSVTISDAVSGSEVGLDVWGIRSAGLALLVVGFALVGGPLAAIANIVPGIGAMVRFGTGFFAAMLGLGVGIGTIALVWLFYRPWFSVTLLLGGAALIAGIAFVGIQIANVRYKSDSLS